MRFSCIRVLAGATLACLFQSRIFSCRAAGPVAGDRRQPVSGIKPRYQPAGTSCIYAGFGRSVAAHQRGEFRAAAGGQAADGTERISESAARPGLAGVSAFSDAGRVRRPVRSEQERPGSPDMLACGPGLMIEHLGEARNWIMFGETAGQIGRAFHITLRYY